MERRRKKERRKGTDEFKSLIEWLIDNTKFVRLWTFLFVYYFQFKRFIIDAMGHGEPFSQTNPSESSVIDNEDDIVECRLESR